MTNSVFIQFAVILTIAFIVSYIVRLFKQPIVIGYIVAGVLISPFVLQFGASKELIDILSRFGIAFLLFIVGLHLNPKVIRDIGFPSLVIGIVQMFFTFILGFSTSYYLIHWDVISSVYAGVALMFSSTIVIMKLLSDERELETFHGKIAIGVLIIQDLVAIAVLIIISSTSGYGGSSLELSLSAFILRSLLIGSGLLILTLFVGFFILPPITKSIAKSQELLFLFSIAWCFVIAALFEFFNFSIEIGALLAGVVLSVSPFSTEISSKIRPLRDFFLVLFFIILGLHIQINNLKFILLNAILLSLIVLIFKPLIIMLVMKIFGYTKRNNFLVGTTLAQISEFSLIALTLGYTFGHIGSDVVSTLTLTGILTITLSTYVIIYSNKFYNKISNWLYIFEKKGVVNKKDKLKRYDSILFGYNRIGYGILLSLKKIRKSYLVVDYNPDTINNLKKLRIPSMYGDAYDSDFLDDLPLEHVKLVVSTIPDFETNELLIQTVRAFNKEAIIIARAHSVRDALDLYKRGASYVLTPHFLGGQYVSKMIEHAKIDLDDYKDEKEKHIKHLKEVIGKGMEHPRVEKN